ncbi:rifin PIR protein, putative [Plasmodium reichenowi]|uniref:Rifin PIR protein, putative n=1 Tax=Plasmodium reichenowi TaxID=5854 RepID=A0A2P9DST8_PLARE|nr:rifin PIR protein, putative [Plasmodium reichenowi]
MKVHYINILLFALPLNILVTLYHALNKNKPSITPHTPKIPTTRSLCECELYAPANYENDPQMKTVMDNFNKQTQQRFHEYDDRMKTTRQKCKEQCDKEIQKIILKDKLEKQMEEQLTTLETKIDTDDIPTCVCEKSLADKVEKGCLRCGRILGAAMPELGAISGTALYTLNQWLITATSDAITVAEKTAISKATQAGVQAVKLKIKGLMDLFTKEEACVDLLQIANEANYKCGPSLVESARNLIGNLCTNSNGGRTSFYTTAMNGGPYYVGNFANDGIAKYNATLASKTTEFTTRNMAAVNTAYGGYHTTIIASIVAIVVIVLILVIIYLILRYRRKKKMKKKLQYIKLLEE